ncbi:MAG: right-handed parallel beta-helix repeat-containing protein, partial [Myxococcota bacterium]
MKTNPILTAVMLASVGALFTLSGCIVKATPAKSTPTKTSAPQLRTMKPVECKEDRTVRLDKVKIESDTDAISITGYCKVVITNSEIISKKFAVRASGESSVTIRNSTIQGEYKAVGLTKQASLVSSNTVYVGGMSRTPTSKFNDGGGNQWRG